MRLVSLDPYQYLLVKQDVKRLTGLDVQLVRAIFAQMGYEVSYEEVSWKQHQLDIKNGVRDIAAGAFKNPERGCFVAQSRPILLFDELSDGELALLYSGGTRAPLIYDLQPL